MATEEKKEEETSEAEQPPKKKGPTIEWKTAAQKHEERKRLKRLRTLTGIDDLIGGGIEQGEVVELAGAYGSGKSQLAFTISVLFSALEIEGILNAILIPGELDDPENIISPHVVYIDTEGTFTADRVFEIATARNLDPNIILKKIHVAQPATVKEQMIVFDKIPKRIKPGLVVVDSITRLPREEYIGRATLAERQGILRNFIIGFKSYVRTHECFGIGTNQVIGNPDATPWTPIEAREIPVGGHTLSHAIDTRFHIRRPKSRRTIVRIARLIDSSRYPPGEATFRITAKGAEAVEEEES